jgi:hypothetical protein
MVSLAVEVVEVYLLPVLLVDVGGAVFDEPHEASNIAAANKKPKPNQVTFLFTFCLHFDLR